MQLTATPVRPQLLGGLGEAQPADDKVKGYVAQVKSRLC